jgi:hypothetical protein
MDWFEGEGKNLTGLAMTRDNRVGVLLDSPDGNCSIGKISKASGTPFRHYER